MSTSDLSSCELQSGCSPARESRTMSTSDAAIKLKLARLEAKERESEHKRRLELRQLEISAMEAEAAAHERAMEAQREARKHELAVMESKRRNPPPASSTSPKIHKWERLCPQYDESSDIAEYFITFERLCTLHAIPEDQKMTTLIAKLTGRALDIFNKMPIDDASNYGKFKDLVLKQFQVTPETYRVKFRSLKRGSGLSNVAYANEMRDLVDKWVRGRGITSFEGMCDLVTQEHFLNMCSDEVKQYLWDKKVNAVGELAEYADSYEQAQAAIKHKPLAEGYKVGGKQNHRFTPGSGKKEAGRSPPHSPGTRPKFPVQAEEPKRCYHCKSTEHLRNKCPLLSEAAASQSQAVASFHTGFVKLASTQPSNEHMHAVKLNGQMLLGLRDTGAEISVVRRDLIQEKDLLPGKMAELELVGGYKVLAPLAKVHMQTRDLQAELTVATVANNFAPFLLGNDFFSVAESVPGLVSSEKESCAKSPREGGEVTRTAGGIGECLLGSSAAVKDAASGAGLVVASSCSPGAQGKFQREELDEASSCPLIISPGEGDVPPCSKEATTAADCQEVAGQQGAGPALGCTEACVPKVEVGVLGTAVVGTGPKDSIAECQPNPSGRGGILLASERSVVAGSCESTAGAGSPSLSGDTRVLDPEGRSKREAQMEGQGGPESPPTFCGEGLSQEEGEKSAFEMPAPSPVDQVLRETWGSGLQDEGVYPADPLETESGVPKGVQSTPGKPAVLATLARDKTLSPRQGRGNLFMGGTSQGSGAQPRETPEGGAEDKYGCSTPFPGQRPKHMPELEVFPKEAEESASEGLPEGTENWENAMGAKQVKLSERSLSTVDLLLTLCLLLIHLWDKTKEFTLVVNPLKMWNIFDLWNKLLYMLGMVTGQPHQRVTLQPIPVKSSKSITGLCCCVEGETEAHRLMALVAKCQDTSTLMSIAACILLAILHPYLFASTWGPGTPKRARTPRSDTIWFQGTERKCDQKQTEILQVLPPPWTVSKSLAVSSGGGCDSIPHKALWGGGAYKCMYDITGICFMLPVPCNISP
ncbi:uncharacterized protein LOC135974320 [Chrysemys picta bellii]|uniref:uncharacterized protein LOC135974320 n=1 Tax=Chrysemys picta bellii TaxID=8478 RepID=UPI0032B0FEB8